MMVNRKAKVAMEACKLQQHPSFFDTLSGLHNRFNASLVGRHGTIFRNLWPSGALCVLSEDLEPLREGARVKVIEDGEVLPQCGGHIIA